MARRTCPLPPCALHEDEHLLAVNKPAGWNTHAPHPYAGEGIYDWLRHREPRWADLAIIHRLDKETSGVLVFGKTPLANRSLTEQFTHRAVHKKYILLTDRIVPAGEHTVCTRPIDATSRGAGRSSGKPAQTRFLSHGPAPAPLAGTLMEAVPLTGRTHQVRIHAAEMDFPVLGDMLHGGAPFPRLCLHAAELELQHPESGRRMTFHAPVDFTSDVRPSLREAIVDPRTTTAYRLIHGASDGHPGWYLDRLGDWLLSQSEADGPPVQPSQLVAQPTRIVAGAPPLGVYHKTLTRHVRGAGPAEASPRFLTGRPAPDRFTILENGVRFELSFVEGYSVGLFLDQRENRRRLLTGHVAAGFSLWRTPPVSPDDGRPATPPTSAGPRPTVLNTFAYTCGFSVCAALAGAQTTSLDLARKYLAWGARNFTLNGIDPEQHDFIYGDAFDWLRRLARKNRRFDIVLLDPPTFSQPKRRAFFRAEKDYRKLVAAALPLLNPDGVLFAATNAAQLPAAEFLAMVTKAIEGAGRGIIQRHYVPQPPDFPLSRAEPAYLKTVWVTVS
jgi:23S rRNA (cytosine1962-C5)-methyltransferase